LEAGLHALGVGEGDEVIMPSFTIISCATAAMRLGARPVLVDIDPGTWCMDVAQVAAKISPRTKVVMPVHIYGHPVDMDPLLALREKHGFKILEDAAEVHGAAYLSQRAGGGWLKCGAIGDAAATSFYANKIITTGEGGMVTTNDDALAERLRLLRNLAFIKPRFWHEDAGYNFRMTGFQAALGLEQVKRIEAIIEGKRAMARAYTDKLRAVPGLQLPVELPWARNVYWMYGIVVLNDFGISRDELMKRLAADGIETRTFFCPMNQQPFLRRQPGFRDVACPVAGDIWQRGLYLPSSHTIGSADLQSVVDAIARAKSRG